MTPLGDWRYFVTYTGTVEADGEAHAQNLALEQVYASVHGDALQPIPIVDVRLEGDGE